MTASSRDAVMHPHNQWLPATIVVAADTAN